MCKTRRIRWEDPDENYSCRSYEKLEEVSDMFVSMLQQLENGDAEAASLGFTDALTLLNIRLQKNEFISLVLKKEGL